MECDLGSLQKVREVGEMLREREERLDLVSVPCCSVVIGHTPSVGAACMGAVCSLRPS